MAKPGKKVRDRLLAQQEGRCFYCGAPLPAQDATIEHLKPKTLGDTNAPENLAVCCRAINAKSQVMVDKAMTVKRDKVGPAFGRIDANALVEVERCLAVFLGIAN